MLLQSKKLTDEQFQTLHKHIMSLGYPDLNLDMDPHTLQTLIEGMIAQKNIHYLLQVLHAKKEMRFLNKGLKTPNELMLDKLDIDVATDLINNEFDTYVNRFSQSLHAGKLLEDFDTIMLHIQDNEKEMHQVINRVTDFLNDDNQPIAYRKAIFEKTHEKLFKCLPLDDEKKGEKYKNIYFQYFKYLANNLSISQNAIEAYKQCLTTISPAVMPRLYNYFLNDIAQMIFIEKTGKNEKISLPENSMDVIYNNDSYLDYVPSGGNFEKGNPLHFKGAPIGYNIHLPQGEIKSIIVEVYGGVEKSYKDAYAYFPGKLDDFKKYLLSKNTAVITLNLPDLLELNVHQASMPADLHQKIHDCINEFYRTLKDRPDFLHNRLKELNLNEIPIYLYGASFGGRTAIKQAEMYKHTFDGYISHDGALSLAMERKSDLPRATKGPYQAYLDVAEETQMRNIAEPLLLMQNRDDNTVNAKVTLKFYKKMRKINTDLVRLFMTATGNPAPPSPPGAFVTDSLSKGHFISKQAEDFVRYCETILRFTQKKSFGLSAMSEWQGYKHDKLANQFYLSGTVQQKFIGQVMATSNQAYVPEDFEALWDNQYKPLYYALDYANTLSNNNARLSQEIIRLQSILTDEMIIKTIQAQGNIFTQYIEEFYNIKFSEENKLIDFIPDKEMIAQFRKYLAKLSSRNSGFDFFHSQRSLDVQYFLSTLYRANSSLLEPLYPEFQGNAELNKTLQETKSKLQETLVTERKLLVNVWRQAKEEVLKLPETQSKVLKAKIEKLADITKTQTQSSSDKLKK